MPDSAPPSPIEESLAACDWARLEAGLDAEGCALLPSLLEAGDCERLASLYEEEQRFRRRIVMARHGYGSGEYKYFDYPLPDPVLELRTLLYERLVPTANRWAELLRKTERYPGNLDEFLGRCHEAGQTRPTPLLLAYEAGDFNCLHQDLYGEHAFPLQVAILLSDPGKDFSGGEFVMTEQRPRRQSRPIVLAPGQGDAIVFAVNERPMAGSRGVHRVRLRHGVSRLHGGRRKTLGIIFHDAT